MALLCGARNTTKIKREKIMNDDIRVLFLTTFVFLILFSGCKTTNVFVDDKKVYEHFFEIRSYLDKDKSYVVYWLSTNEWSVYLRDKKGLESDSMRGHDLSKLLDKAAVNLEKKRKKICE